MCTKLLPLPMGLFGLAACLPPLPPANSAPGAPDIVINPGEPRTDTDLQVVFLSRTTDVDSDDVTHTFRWFESGTLREDLTTDTVPASETDKGETWKVVVTPNDGSVDGTPSEAEVVILDTAPVASVTLAPEAPATDEDLVATATSEDVDGDAVTYTYAWTRDGQPVDWTEATVPAARTSPGEMWEVTVVPNDGELDGAPVSASVTVGDTCASPDLDGSGYVTLPYGMIDFGSSYTIAFWVSPDNTSGVGVMLADGTSAYQCPSVWISLRTGVFEANASDGTGPYRCETKALSGNLSAVTALSSISMGWTHVAVVYRGSTMAIYLDGALSVETATYTINPYTPTQSFLIGTESGAPSSFDGRLQDFAIWNTALNASDVARLGAGTDLPSDYGYQLVAFWPMNEGSGSTLYDVSGNGYHASLTNGTWDEDCR